MSTFYIETICCPYCGNPDKFSVARTINATRSPQYREEILGGTFQVFRCTSCHKRFVADLPFMYFDYESSWWIGQFPQSEERHWRECEQAVVNAFEIACGANAPAVARELGAGMKLRTVFGLTALREKLLCIQENLSDSVLELVKLKLMLLPDGGIPLKKGQRVRLTSLDEENLYFSLLNGPKERFRKPPTLIIKREFYRRLEDEQTTDWLELVGAGTYLDIRRILWSEESSLLKR